MKLRKFGNEENLKIVKAQKESKVILFSKVTLALQVSIELTTHLSDNAAILVQIRNILIKTTNSKINIILIAIKLIV